MGRTPEDPETPKTSQLEDEIRGLLESAGAEAREVGPTAVERERTDIAAREALGRILASPRGPESGYPGTAHGVVARFRALLTGRQRRVGTIILVAAIVGLLLVVRQPTDVEDPGSPYVAQGSTPAMAEFQLASSKTGTTLDGEDAQAMLRSLASTAAQQDERGSGPVQLVSLDSWFLTQEPGTGNDPVTSLIPTLTRHYFLPDGKVRSIESRGAPLDDAGQITEQVGTAVETSDETFPGPDQGPSHPERLPSAPAALAKALIADPAECPVVAACLVTEIVNLNYTWVLPPRLVAALWLTLADQPAVTYLGSSTDRLGRPAIAFAVQSANKTRKTVLYADADTGLLLGSEEVLLTDDAALDLTAPAVLTFTAVAESRRIELDQVP